MNEAWVKKFPDPHAYSIAVWLRYRGAVVHDWVAVVADGGRYLLPLPEVADGAFQIRPAKLPLARLLFDLHGTVGVHQPIERALSFADVSIVD
jgi:hypothetical protein